MWKHLVWRRRNIGQRKYLIYDEAETKFYTSPSHTTSDILSISHDLSLLLSNSPKSKFKNGKNINYFTFQQGSRPALIYVDKILKLLKKNKTLNWIVFFNSEKILVCLKRFMVNRGGDHAWMLISLGSEKKRWVTWDVGTTWGTTTDCSSASGGCRHSTEDRKRMDRRNSLE